MFITEEQLEERLKSPRNLANIFKGGKYAPQVRETEETQGTQNVHQEGIQFREIKRPGNNRPWLSKSDRTRIAADVAAQTNDIDENRTTQTEIARRYGVSVSTVSDISNGVRRIEDGTRTADMSKVDAALSRIREKASERLMSSLDQITDDKLSGNSAKDLSSIAANMARVVQQTIPQEKGNSQINLIVYTPELRKEQNFDSVEI